MLQVALLFLLCTGALAQIPHLGKCPKVEVVQNFDVSNYMGVWYEAHRYFTTFELGGKCVTANYTLNKDGSVKVVNRQLNRWTGKPKVVEGTAKLVNSSKKEGNLTVVFPVNPEKTPSPYLILDTDYKDYAVVYTCTQIKFFHAQFVWILTRKREPLPTVVERALSVLDKYKISRGPLLTTDQKNC